MSEPDEIDWIIAASSRLRSVCSDGNSDIISVAMDIRAVLKAAGYVIAPATSALLNKGADAVDGGRVHD